TVVRVWSLSFGGAGLSGPEIFGPVGCVHVPHLVDAQPHLRDWARRIGKKRGIGEGEPLRIIARIGAADALIDPIEEAADDGVCIAAAIAGTAAAGTL